MNDTRKERRLPVALVARYREPTMLEPREGECRDLSPGGMFIMTPRPSPRGALVRFECASQEPDELFRGTGRVVWQRNKSDPRGPAGMGIRFVRLEGGGREALQRIVERVHLERQRERAEGGRRTSSGPPPRVRGSDPVASQAAPILSASGNGSEPSASGPEKGGDLRQGTMRGLGVQVGRSVEAGEAASRAEWQPAAATVPRTPAPSSPLPPSPMPAPTSAGRFGSTLLDGTPSSVAAVISGRSPLPPPLDSPAGLGSTVRTHVDAAASRSEPASALEHASARPGAHEALDRTRPGFGTAGSAEEAQPGQNRAAVDVRNLGAASIRQAVDRVMGTNVGPRAASERAGRPSDRPPQPGGIDDLRVRGSLPPREPLPNADATASQSEPIEPTAEPSNRPASSKRRKANASETADAGQFSDSGSRSGANYKRIDRGLWIILGIGMLASVGLIAAFGTIPFLGAHSDKPIPRPVSDPHLAPKATPRAQTKPLPVEAPQTPPRAPAEPPPVAPSPAAPNPTTTALPSPSDTNLAQAPAAALPLAVQPLVPPALAPTATALAPEPARSSSLKPRPVRAKGAAEPPPAPEPEPIAAPVALETPAPQTAAEPPSQTPPFQQALDCLARADNRCVIRALADKANSERELDLLIATYRTVGNSAGAEREMKRYIERFPSGQHVKEYLNVLGQSPPATQPSAPSTAPAQP